MQVLATTRPPGEVLTGSQGCVLSIISILDRVWISEREERGRLPRRRRRTWRGGTEATTWQYGRLTYGRGMAPFERATACNSTDDCRDRGGQVAGADRGAHERSSVCVVNSIIVQHAEVSIVRRAMVVCMTRGTSDRFAGHAAVRACVRLMTVDVPQCRCACVPRTSRFG
jgi:hypothetical protein